MRRSILLTSLPRSGSSWVGWVLGQADGVTYEREPITQGLLAAGVDPFSVASVATPTYAALVEELSARDRRLVVKEVSPLLAASIGARLDAQVVLLERHPVAVCRSHVQLGWVWDPDVVVSNRFPESPARDVLARIEGANSSFWAWHGAYQAAVAVTARSTLGDALVVITYESLVKRPKRGFRELGRALGLEWAAGVPKPEGKASSSPFSLVRQNRSAPRSWSDGVEGAHIAECRSGWEMIEGAPSLEW